MSVIEFNTTRIRDDVGWHNPPPPPRAAGALFKVLPTDTVASLAKKVQKKWPELVGDVYLHYAPVVSFSVAQLAATSGRLQVGRWCNRGLSLAPTRVNHNIIVYQYRS